jgi:hypothetical protein
MVSSGNFLALPLRLRQHQSSIAGLPEPSGAMNILAGFIFHVEENVSDEFERGNGGVTANQWEII